MSIIALENMEFHAYHGCLEHEKSLGNTFIVNLSMEMDTQRAGQTDELDDTTSYQLIYDEVKTQMEIPSKLIEHVGQRILNQVWIKFPQILALDVQLSKLNPPLGGKVQRVTITLTKNGRS